jgi:hypothetical protein
MTARIVINVALKTPAGDEKWSGEFHVNSGDSINLFVQTRFPALDLLVGPGPKPTVPPRVGWYWIFYSPTNTTAV